MAIFKVFSNRYIHKWDSAIEGREQEIAKEWSTRLSTLTGKQIKIGLKNWDQSWPPTCDEFKKCCLTKKNTIPYHKIFKTEKLIESDGEKHHRKATATLWLAKIKSSIQ